MPRDLTPGKRIADAGDDAVPVTFFERPDNRTQLIKEAAKLQQSHQISSLRKLDTTKKRDVIFL